MEFGTLRSTQPDQPKVRDLSSASASGRPGSTADLFPKLVSMQKSCAGQTFAVLTAQAQTLLSPGQLVCLMLGPGSEARVESMLEDQSAALLSHLIASPLPLAFAPAKAIPLPRPPVRVADSVSGDNVDLAFPVQLGSMGNGYVIFFNIQQAIGNDMLIDLHRKSVAVMREALRLAFGAVTLAEKFNEREIECLQLVGNGMKSEAIGERLGLSVHTINAYLGSATTKLDAVNRIQAIAKAIRLGIIA